MQEPLTDKQKDIFMELFNDLYAMYQNSMAWADNGIPFRDRIENFIKEYQKANPVEDIVSDANGGQIAKIRNLFTPILNYFTMAKERRKLYGKLDRDSRKRSLELNKIEMVEKKNIMRNNITEEIKKLLDELG